MYSGDLLSSQVNIQFCLGFISSCDNCIILSKFNQIIYHSYFVLLIVIIQFCLKFISSFNNFITPSIVIIFVLFFILISLFNKICNKPWSFSSTCHPKFKAKINMSLLVFNKRDDLKNLMGEELFTLRPQD